jgi:hypothetical protein
MQNYGLTRDYPCKGNISVVTIFSYNALFGRKSSPDGPDDNHQEGSAFWLDRRDASANISPQQTEIVRAPKRLQLS